VSQGTAEAPLFCPRRRGKSIHGAQLRKENGKAISVKFADRAAEGGGVVRVKYENSMSAEKLKVKDEGQKADCSGGLF